MADQVSGRRQLKYETGQSVSREKEMRSSDVSVCESSWEDEECTKKSDVRSVYNSSEEFYEYKCDPCRSFNDYYEAEGFCTVCKEYLCRTCFRSHSRNKVSKHHALLAKDDMPRKSSKLCNPCKTAEYEILAVGYCKDCSDFLCNGCFKSHPRNKLSRDHVLVKQEKIEETEQAVATSFPKMNITKGMSSGLNIEERYIYVRNINVKSDNDERECHITDMTSVSLNELVICDTANECLKYVNIDKNMIKDVLSLPNAPFGITALSNNEIAVALPDMHQIKIISVNKCLNVNRTIKTNGSCKDVKMMNGRLYVFFSSPVKFQILQPTGKIIKTIKLDQNLIRYCIHPVHMAVTPDESIIYVSDWKTDTVMSLDMNGNRLALYQCEEKPYGITISPSGSVYLCSERVVFRMNTDLSTPVVILTRKDGLVSPEAIYLDTLNRRLIISSGCSKTQHRNALKVYKY